MPAKVGIKSCRFAKVCFICACMDVPTQLELCLYDQLDIARLLLVSLILYCDPYSLFKLLIFYCHLAAFYLVWHLKKTTNITQACVHLCQNLLIYHNNTMIPQS